MPLLDGDSDFPKKKLKFHCTNCGAEIVTQYLRPGDTLICSFCKKETIIPIEAIETQEEPTIRKILEKESILFKRGLIDAKEEVSEPIAPTPWGTLSVVKFIGAELLLFTSLSCVVGAVLSFLIYATVPEVRNDQESFQTIFSPLINKITVPLIWLTSLGLIYHVVVKRHKNSFFSALRITGASRQSISKYSGVAASLAAIIIILSLVIYFTPLSKFVPEEMPFEEIFKEGYSGLLWLTVTALLAPFPEEIVFRGFIYKGLEPRFGRIGSGSVVTVLFILLHAPQLGFGILPLILIAIIAVTLIVVRIRTDSLTNCIIIHFLYNSILIFLAWSCVLIFGIKSLTQ